MMLRIRRPGALAVAVILCCLAAGANAGNPLMVRLDEDGTRFIRFGGTLQIWGRYTQTNPGSVLTDDGAVQDGMVDISLRRFRASADLQFTPRAMAWVMVGFNNLNHLSSRKTSVDLLDAWAEYTVGEGLAIGAGKSLWRGLSRYSAPSASRILTLDLPLVAQPTINFTDDLLRHLGVWAKGRVAQLDYRVLAFSPFPVAGNAGYASDPVEGVARLTDDGLRGSLATSAYLKWQFFEQESNRLPFSPGTYLGARKVLNLGLGYEFQLDRTHHLDGGEPVFNDMLLWAVDGFADIPLGHEGRTAVTAYAAMFKYDFGPNTVRNMGANNPARDVAPGQGSFNGAGNAYPIIGTGRSFYVQAGYLLPPMGRAGRLGRLQPFADLQTSDLEGLDERMTAWHLGLNWLLNGHDSKFSLAYQSRPVYTDVEGRLTVLDRRSMVVLQYQVRL